MNHTIVNTKMPHSKKCRRNLPARFFCVCITFLMILCSFQKYTLSLSAASAPPSDPVVVVLDPGHGGSSNGAEFFGIKEKDIDLAVATLIHYYLSQFEGVTVHMTRTTDIDVSLAERADFANAVNADFFCSVHFNASDTHNVFGSEVWVSAFGENYVKGAQFADILLANWANHLGLYSRGCKTRLNSRGADYYGVIRMSSEYQIPSCIIEHCHIDNPTEVQTYMNPKSLQEMAYQDAVSIAQYFGLSSKSLGLDFSNYPKTPYVAPICAAPDLTAPDFVAAAPLSANSTTKTVSVVLNALDSNGIIRYYSYSLDNGYSWSQLYPYSGGPIAVTIQLNNLNNTILFRVYNQYDVSAASNMIDPF